MIKAQIIADSLNQCGNRLTTFVLKYPRIVHSEFMTHRVFSRNAASSRAIPSKRIVQEIKDSPAMPVFWGANQSGMQAAAELDDTDKSFRHDFVDVDGSNAHALMTRKEKAKALWLQARDLMVSINEQMQNVGLHKQIANRILEPWFHMETLASSTDFENFFALRCHKDAQPEIAALADAALKVYCESKPTILGPGEWHLPFGKMEIPDDVTIKDRLKIGTARAARISYKNFDGQINITEDFQLHDRLSNSGHWSTFEHSAMALATPLPCGNFIGWIQYRKMFPGENRRVNPRALLAERVAAGSRFAQGATE